MPSRRGPVPKTVEEYLARVSPEFRPLLDRLRKTIRAAAPGAEEVISYQMPAFRQDGILVWYAAFKDHCSLYLASSDVRRRFHAELRPFEAGRGTSRFTVGHPLPDDLVIRLVRAMVAENAAKNA